MSSPVGKIRSIDRPSALQVMRDKEKNRKLNKDDKAYVRKCPHDHLLVYRQSCIVVKGTTRLTQKIRCSTCGALQMRRAKVYACELCKWYLCTWCSSAKREYFNTFSFSRFYYVTQITRISLTHTARKSLENQRLNVHLIMMNTKLALRARTQVRIVIESRWVAIILMIEMKIMMTMMSHVSVHTPKIEGVVLEVR